MLRDVWFYEELAVHEWKTSFWPTKFQHLVLANQSEFIQSEHVIP